MSFSLHYSLSLEDICLLRREISLDERLVPKSRTLMSPNPKPQTMANLLLRPSAVDASDDEDDVENERRSESKRPSTRSTESKGKGRAVDPDRIGDMNHFLASDNADGRVKRVRKERRLSATGEVDPDDLDDDGRFNRNARRKSSHLQNGQSKEVSPNADDRLYFARLDQNCQRLPLRDMKGLCPVWAKTRRALQSAADYLRQPVKTVGASVHVGVGGIARGVILEGQAAGQGTYWGTGKRAGTIVTSM